MEYRTALGYKKGNSAGYFFGKSKSTQEKGPDVAIWSELTKGNINFEGSTLVFKAISGYPKLRLSLKMAKKIQKQGGESMDERSINVLFKPHGQLKEKADALKLSIYCDEKEGLTSIYNELSSAKKVKEVDQTSGTLAMGVSEDIQMEEIASEVESDDLLDIDLDEGKEKKREKKKKEKSKPKKEVSDPFNDDFFGSDDDIKSEKDDLLDEFDVDFKEEDDDFWN